MSYRDTTYVIFDGDNDMWAYAYMKGWNKNPNCDFRFADAHDLEPLTARAENGGTLKLGFGNAWLRQARLLF